MGDPSRLKRLALRGASCFGAITVVFAYTLVTNVVERPDGIKIASLFIIAILLTSSASRIHRAFKLRAAAVTLDENAIRLIDQAAAAGPLRIIANEPQEHSTVAYRAKEYSQREQTPYSRRPPRALPGGLRPGLLRLHRHGCRARRRETRGAQAAHGERGGAQQPSPPS